MPLAAGTRIGPYDILGALGAGGMGEVYRARDARLNRDVAIKVLSASFATDPERLARFAREAQLLAALNHPNIAHVHGLEDTALVMELVEGPTLADRLAAGSLALDDAVPIARQIADALEAAHAAGIVHRDLKPANIKVRADGTVKVLDFGLAKLIAPEGAALDSAMANSPTFTAPPSEHGLLLGTAAYMAPEQARGRPIDRRADIWAFGVVLFEMLAGRRLFAGDTTSEVLASVLKEDPDWSLLPADTPPAIRRLLRRCLEKDPRRRLRDIGDARLELDDAAQPPGIGTPHAPRHTGLARTIAAALAGAALAAAVLLVVVPRRQPAPPADIARVAILPPPGERLYMDAAESAISPDGRHVVFRTGALGQPTQLWVRSLDSQTPRPLAGTSAPFLPFWSPDSTRIGFFDEGKLKTIARDGGTTTVVCNARDGRGATWNAAGVIVFAPSNAVGLMKVSAEGGDPQPVTALDPSRGETAHRFPYFLPDGRRFLFTALSSRDRFDIVVASLDGPERKPIVSTASGAVYARPGYLLFMRPNGLAAQAFDAANLTFAGDPVTLPDVPTAVAGEWLGGPPVSVSNAGAMTYIGGPARRTKLAWFDLAAGKETGSVDVPPGYYDQVVIAPDGRRAAVSRAESAIDADIFIVDLERGGATRLTSGPAANRNPLWSPDGTRIAYGSDRIGTTEFFARPAAGGPEETLLKGGALFKELEDWAPDGRTIIYSQLDPQTQRDLWILPLDGDRTPRPFIATPQGEFLARISPDGHWVTYLSRENGPPDLYVQSYPTPGERYRVTRTGVSFGRFSTAGTIVYAVPGDPALYAVDVQPGPPFRTGPPRVAGRLPPDLISGDALPDFSRLLFVLPAEPNAVAPLTLVTNWTAALRKQP